MKRLIDLIPGAKGHEGVDVAELQEELKDLTSGFELLFRANPLPMAIYDRETLRFLDVNSSMLQSYGYTQEEFMKLRLLDLRPADQAPALLEHLRVCHSMTSCPKHVAHHKTKSGELIDVEIASHQLRYQGRDAQLTVVNDVSRTIRAEEAYESINKRYQNIFENAVEGFYQNLPSGRFINVNPAFARMLGYDSPDELCHTINDIATDLYVHPEQRLEFRRQLELYNMAKGLEFEAFRKDGSRIWISVNVRAVRNENDEVLYYEGTAEDISARKDAEAGLAIAHARLEKKAEELSRSNGELQQFAYAASHDLQEPLRMISSYLELISVRYRGKLDVDVDDYIGFAVDGAKRMKSLIDDLLAYSRVGSSQTVWEVTDCNSVLTRALKNLEVAITEADAKIECAQLPQLMGAPTQLCQLFQNLVSNALKFRGENAAEISIGVEQRGPEWLFSVRDSGIGFEMGYSDRIFRIFQRLHARMEYPGTGVGLAICKKIVEVHGGRIWVESFPGKGTTFFFTLPALTKNH